MGDFVKFLIVLLQKDGTALPFRNHKSWQQLFYKLKASTEFPEKPAFFNTLRFDWDDNYPKSPELSEFLHSLCITGILICDSPRRENYRLTEALFALWEERFRRLDEPTRKFLEQAAEIAGREFIQTTG